MIMEMIMGMGRRRDGGRDLNAFVAVSSRPSRPPFTRGQNRGRGAITGFVRDCPISNGL